MTCLNRKAKRVSNPLYKISGFQTRFTKFPGFKPALQTYMEKTDEY